MSEFGIKLLINIIIGIIVFGGFFIFWGRTSGALKEGGIVYEYFKNEREKSKEKRQKSKTKDLDSDVIKHK